MFIIFLYLKVFIFIFEYILNILHCIYNINSNSIQYQRHMIQFIEVNCFDGPGVFMNILIHFATMHK